ncbi:NAD-dependent dehydratase [Streptomyces sp. TS71-3]|nr:NAD-dependent dehydratase [Streptomyces sp. TS71-3]
MRLEKLLSARGDEVMGLIRNAAQAEDLLAAGAEPAVCDLESAGVDEVARHLQGADTAVFAAGAGPGSGVERKETVDRAAAVLFADAAERAGARRFLLVSSQRADPNHAGDEVIDAYLRAKGKAEEAIRGRSGLDWTILRPGRLTNDRGTGLVRLEASTGRGSIPRDDVAAVLAELGDSAATAGLTLDLIGGSTPVSVAVKSVAGN